jgi:FixJ family two-component response regulator
MSILYRRGYRLVDTKYTLLIVDDEQNIINSLKRLFRRDGYNLLSALNGEDALKILHENDVQLVISDQRMAGMSGTEFLARVKSDFPDIIRIILSGYTDVDAITESINKGHIYKFFLKPWDDHNLRLEIKQCIEQYELIKKNRELNEIVVNKNKELETMNEELKRINDNLETIVKQRTKDLEIQNQALELSRAIFEYVPLPVVGISSDGMIAMSNKMALGLTNDTMGFEIGKNISEYISVDANNLVDGVINKGDSETIENYSFMGKTYKILVAPLLGQFKGKGVIFVLI